MPAGQGGKESRGQEQGPGGRGQEAGQGPGGQEAENQGQGVSVPHR